MNILKESVQIVNNVDKQIENDLEDTPVEPMTSNM